MAKVIGFKRSEWHITNEKTGEIDREFVGHKIYVGMPIAVEDDGMGVATYEFRVADKYFPKIFGGFTPADLPKLLEKDIEHLELSLEGKTPRLVSVRYAAGVAK